MRFLVNNFLKGCLVLVPTVATVYVVVWVFVTMDGLLDFGPPGVGVVTTIALITLFGALTSNVVGKTLFSAVERVLKSVPLVKLLYSSLKDFLGALIGDRRSFDRPVVVTLNQGGAKAFGFVTHDDLSAYGLTDHSKVDYRLKGDTTVSGPGFVFGSSAGSYDASLELTTPESVDLSVTHELNADWTLYAGSTWTRWSRLEEIRADNKGVGGLLGGALTSISEPQNWHDTWAHAVGAAYKLNRQWTLRAGLAVDQSPTNNADRSPRIPSGDRTILSLGAAWSPNEDMTVDLAYSYLMEDDADIERDDYRSTYKNTAHGLGTQVTYRF
jgi:opacity protein-like surface antigen